MKQLHIGSRTGIEIIILPVAWFVSLALWIVLSAAAIVVIGIPFGSAVLLGFVVMLLHWISEVIHHFGHALAARRTRYPMQAIKIGGIYGILALSSYPAGEPPLPDSIHIRRALGGPIASLLPTIIFGIAALLLNGSLWWAAIFLFVENLIFTIQVFLPMGKLLDNDGNTLWRWWRGREKVAVSATPGE